MVSGDEADQSATHAAFSRLHRELARRLAAGKLTVVDATSLEPSSRRALLARAAAAGVPATAIVFDLPAETVLARNAARRQRVVDESVVRHHLARLRASLDGPVPPLSREGFAQVVVLRDPAEVDAVSDPAAPEPDDQPERPGAHLDPDAVGHVDVAAGDVERGLPRRPRGRRSIDAETSGNAPGRDDDPGVHQLDQPGQMASTERDAGLGRVGRVRRLDQPGRFDRRRRVGWSVIVPPSLWRAHDAVPAAMQTIAPTARAMPRACVRVTRSRRKTVARITVITG